MQVYDIERITELPTSAELSLMDERRALAQEASAKLGYSQLAKTLTNKPVMFLQQLLNLGIEPFVLADVERYKRSKKKVGMWSGTKDYLTWMGGVLILGAGTVGCFLMTAHAKAGTPVETAWMALTFLFGVLAVLGGILSVNGLDKIGIGTRTITNWYVSSLAGYDGMVPEHVLMTALKVKEACPNVSFQVEYLTRTDEFKQRKPRRLPDPFLTAMLDGEVYYIAVWDERQFERQL
jgi:hypothetical protein